jgi:nitroreductase
MNTLTKLALGLMGQLKARPAAGPAAQSVALALPDAQGGMDLMQALWRRQSQREFSIRPLPEPLLGGLLWAAAGVNRPSLGGRTAPSAMNSQEVDVFVALPSGLYLYDAASHALRLEAPSDVRAVTGYQDFTDQAALDLVFVADHRRMTLVPAAQREAYAYSAAGAMAQNVYLYCAAQGLATVIRAWIDRHALSQAMALGADQQVLLAQTVGYPKQAPVGP